MRILYLDCFSGISGDMTLASLVDLGADRNFIEGQLKKLGLTGYSLSWRRVVKKGISALKADVLLDSQDEAGGSGTAQPIRHYTEIVKLIGRAELTPRAAQLSLDMFAKIGDAEAKIHDIPLEKVHFHEVGAIDSIVDIVGVALAIESLNPDRILCSPVPLGSGTVRMDHGVYPVPAPATLELMRGLPVAPSHHTVELTTPTGAAIVSVAVDEFSSGLPPMTIEAIGYGAGTRELPNQPNVLRSVLGSTEKRLHIWHAHQPDHVDHHHHHDGEHHHSEP